MLLVPCIQNPRFGLLSEVLEKPGEASDAFEQQKRPKTVRVDKDHDNESDEE